MGATPSNPFGHFEALPAVQINEGILDLLGSNWDAPLHEPVQTESLARGTTGNAAAKYLESRAAETNPLIKDPRFCLTLPFWRECIPGDDLRIVLMIRHPTDVAASLRSRDFLPPEYGRYLWHRYNQELLHAGHGVLLIPVVYESLVGDPSAVLQSLSADLGLGATKSQVERAALTLDSGVRYHHTNENDNDNLSIEEVRMWEALRSLRSGPHTRISRQPDAQSSADEAFRMMAGLSSNFDRALTEITALLEGERDAARDAFTNASRERDEARAALDHANKKLRVTEEQLTHAAEEHQRRLLELERSNAEAISAMETQIMLNQELQGRGQNEAETRNRLVADLSEARVDVENLSEALDTTSRQLSVFKTSRAGKAVVSYWKAREMGRRLIGRSDPVRQPEDEVQSATEEPDPELAFAPDELPEGVRFEAHDEPVVSIVVPVHGQMDVTVACLRSLAEHQGITPFEVIVVDDLSPDRSAEWLDTCTNVNVIRNEENLGYLRSTNLGASHARGPLIQLLNNDTTVSPGWLDTLVDTIQRDEDIGAVGSKLVYPDGTLQEAGTIIWSDGTGWNFGRNEDSEDYLFNFVREVDYCSAASLMVRRELWETLGGFDERYAPAYYEDSDLCFGLRSLGFRTLYQPKSVVTHFEGVSHGTDESSGHKPYQAANREKFIDKWALQLDSHLPPMSDPVLGAWRGRGQRVIVFDHEVPAENHDSGSVRMTAILDLLVEMGFKVTFVPHNRIRREPHASVLCDRGVQVAWGWIDWREMVRDQSPELAFIIASRPSVAAEVFPFVTEVAPDVPIVYDMVDFHGLRIERRSEVLGSNDMKHSIAMGELEKALIRAADLTIAVTDDEGALINEQVPHAEVTVLPNIHRSPVSTASFGERTGILFVGSFRHTPNRDAITWLVEEIMPEVWKDNPSITLHLVGSDLPDDFVKIEGKSIENHGWVEDLDPLFNAVRLTVAPLRFGAGLKGKVGDSLMRGVPVVTTPIGAEGFGSVAQFMSIAESSEDLAEQIVRVHSNSTIWQEMSTAGRESVDHYFGFDAGRSALARITSMAADLRQQV